MPLQLPPAVGSSGQAVETVIVDAASSDQHHVMTIGSGASTAYAPVTSSGGLLIAVSNPSTAVTVTNQSTAVTVTNPSTQVNTLSSGPILVLSSGPVTGTVNTLSSGPVLVLSSGPMTIAGTVTVLSASSGLVQISGTPLVNVVGTSSGVAVVTTSGGLSIHITDPSGPVSSSWGVLIQPTWSLSTSRLIVATSVGKISSAPGVLTMLAAYSTATPVASASYIRLYDQTTGNATSANNSGLAGACALFRIQSSVAGGEAQPLALGQGVKFATACSFDIVIAATSTAVTLAGWVTAQYSS